MNATFRYEDKNVKESQHRFIKYNIIWIFRLLCRTYIYIL